MAKGTPLNVLLVEDLAQDAMLVLRELSRGGYEVQHERVETQEELIAALERGPWDVILSDYSMPRFSGPAALSVVKEKKVDVPFIIISGTVGEDIAVESIQAGAHDFMSKEKLRRLVPAIEREIRNASLRAERAKMQDQLMISDRMASMGTLAAGVAHEINNPLACVMANIDLASREIAEKIDRLGLALEFAEVCEEMRDAREAADRIRNIVRDLRIFSHSSEERTGAVDVQRVMESTLRMAWNEIRHRARLVKSYEPTPLVEASESRLGQVFLNLIVNAVQAIAEGRAQDNEIRVRTRALDGMVLVEIEDTGPGMSREVMSRLFTPFFTTKPVGVGTGLGLSICHRIVTGLGGRVEVQSQEGKGTVFQVFLPPARSHVKASISQEMPASMAARRRGKILVVDDEPMITSVTRRTLSDDHEVVTLNASADALRLIEEGARFDVILCDIMMPQMTGMEFHAELLRVAPDQADRMVFVTGGAFTPATRAFLERTKNRQIEKPFDARRLHALINNLVK